MKIKINGIHLDTGESLQEYVSAKLSPLVEKYFPSPIEGTVTFTKTGVFFHAEISVHAKRGVFLNSHADADDIYVAFDQASAKIEKRLRRHKNKIKDHSKKSEAADAIKIRYLVLNGTDYTADEKDESLDKYPAIVAETPQHIDALTVSEAVLRMDLGELPALLFKNAAHGEFNMIYRRKDGNVGWIDPKNI